MKKKLIALALAFAVFAQGGVFAKSLAVQTHAADQADAITLSKTISQVPDDKGQYTIALESYTTGAVTMGEIGDPLDIVLVLDQSGSMIYNFKGKKTDVQEHKIQYALINAVTHFVNTVHQNAVDYGLNHRIGIITFDSGADVESGFEDVETNEGYQKITDAVNALGYDLEGATKTHFGMREAKHMFEDDPYEGTEARDKVLVMFSDGQPSDTTYSNKALEYAEELKNTKQVTIYTIGTFAGADPTVISGTDSAEKGEMWLVSDKNKDATIANRFMNYLSSNSNDAGGMGLWYSGDSPPITCKITKVFGWENKGYYSTAKNAQDLDKMFDNISHSITVDAPSLDETGQLKDFLSPYFVFPDDFTNSAILLQTAACTGVDESGAYQWAAPTELTAESGVTAQFYENPNKITVTGFDYATNVVTERSKSDTEADFGKKLIVSFLVKPKDGFLGGNHVVSNTGDSGIYTEQDEPLKFFEIPDTDVVLSNVPVQAIDHSIYQGNSVNSGDAVKLAQSPFDGINNAYVNTKLSIYWDENENGTLEESERAHFETVEIPAGFVTDTLAFQKQLAPQSDAKYLVEQTITPISEGTQAECNGILDDFGIYVLTPSVSVQDVWVDYGVQVPLSQHCIKEVLWQYADATPADAPKPTGQEPTVRLVVSPEVENDIYTATKEKTFTVQSLAWESTDGNATPMARSLTGENQSEFAVHLNLCNLTLTKTVDAKELSTCPQTFFFTVQQGAQSFCVGMTPQELASGTCSKSVIGLYAGQEIQVAEDDVWAWRYTTDDLPATVLHQNFAQDGVTPLISSEPVPVGEKTLAAENTRENPYWLSSEDTVVNRFDRKGASA